MVTLPIHQNLAGQTLILLVTLRKTLICQSFGRLMLMDLLTANIQWQLYLMKELIPWSIIRLEQGVGAGAIVNGEFVGDLGHPEMGHVRLKRHPDDLDFDGICPFHGDCLEGLVAGPTFRARTGKRGQDVPLTDHVWDIMAFYVAQAAIQVTLTLRPAKVVFGGGVVSEPFLKRFAHTLRNY